jgi:hypothetical protein
MIRLRTGEMRTARIVIPVRSLVGRKRSIERTYPEQSAPRQSPDRLYANTIAYAADNDIPVTMVSYESMVADPEKEGALLAEICGLTPAPWPTEGNEDEPWKGKVYNANA